MVAICISSGHGLYVRGASGYLDEVDCARAVVDKVAEYLRQMNVQVWVFHDNTSHDQSTNLNTIVAAHNSHPSSGRLDISVHFNAYQTTSKPMGTEVLFVSSKGEAMATELSPAIAYAVGFFNRGPKYRDNLAFLNGTNGSEGAVLIETCFVDSKADADLFNIDENFIAICQAIAETTSGQTLDEPEQPPEQPPEGERPPLPQPPQTGTVHGLVPGDVLNIRATASSSSPIIGIADNNDLLTVVGYAMNGDTKYYKCQWGDPHMAGIAVYGFASAAYVTVEGDVDPIEQGWHDDIEATEFGSGSDNQDSAYPDIDWINDTTRGVALPYKWKETPRPKVVVKGPSGEIETEIVDLGPWNLDDQNYVLGAARPLAEEQYANRTEAQNGQVPTNRAGIDLTPPIADAIGISGKGSVSWRFANEGHILSEGRATTDLGTSRRQAVQFFHAGKSDPVGRPLSGREGVHSNKRNRSNPARHGKGGAGKRGGHKAKGKRR